MYIRRYKLLSNSSDADIKWERDSNGNALKFEDFNALLQAVDSYVRSVDSSSTDLSEEARTLVKVVAAMNVLFVEDLKE